MKVPRMAMCLAVIAGMGISAVQATVLIDFGGSSSSAGQKPYWNGVPQLTNNQTVSCKDDKGNTTPYSLKYTGNGASVISTIPALITSTLLGKIAYAMSDWKSTYGYDIIDTNLKTAIGGSASLTSERTSTYTLSGLTAGNQYSLSLFVYTNVLLTGDAAKLTFTGGSDVKIKNYKDTATTPVLLGLNQREVSLLKNGQQMITVEFTAGANGTAALQFVTPKGALTNTTSIQALVCRDLTKPVPEASTALLGVLGLGGLLVRRRRAA